MKKIISLGKIDYNGTGRKVNEVTIEIEIKRNNTKDINLNPVLNGYSIFRMSANVYNSKHTDIIAWGQMCDKLPKLFPNNKDVKRLVEIWENWHLNDMNSGTKKQMDAVEKWEQNGNKYDYTKVCEYLKSIDLHIDNGYQYGTSWLLNPLPSEIETEVNNIIERLTK